MDIFRRLRIRDDEFSILSDAFNRRCESSRSPLRSLNFGPFTTDSFSLDNAATLIGGDQSIPWYGMNEMLSGLASKNPDHEIFFRQIKECLAESFKEHSEAILHGAENAQFHRQSALNSFLERFMVVSEPAHPAAKLKKFTQEVKTKTEVLVIRPMKVEDLKQPNLKTAAFRGQDGKIFLSESKTERASSSDKIETGAPKKAKTSQTPTSVPKIVIEEAAGGHTEVSEADVHLIDSEVFDHVVKEVVTFAKIEASLWKTAQPIQAETTKQHTLKYIKPERYSTEVEREKVPVEKTLSQTGLEETKKHEERLVEQNFYYTLKKVRETVAGS